MSNSQTNNTGSTPNSGEISAKNRITSTRLLPSESLLSPVRTVSFWTAVTVPFLSLLLLLSGIDTPAEQQAFLALLVLNVVALLVGHSYNE